MSLKSLDTLQISKIIEKNNRGPNIEPWGTPQYVLYFFLIKLIIQK